jgi:hypothetical protein
LAGVLNLGMNVAKERWDTTRSAKLISGTACSQY